MFLRIAQLDAKTLQHVVDRIESHSRTADSVYTTTSREQAEASVAGGSGNGPEGSGEAVKTVRIEEPKRESRFDVRDMGCLSPVVPFTLSYYRCNCCVHWGVGMQVILCYALLSS
jgi:hypothetical protein